MKASVISTILLLATATRIQKANGALSGEEQLRVAVILDNVDLVKSLLASGVDAKAINNVGESALMLAAYYGNPKLVELLLPKSDAKATNNIGETALMWAAGSGNAKSVELLLPKSDPKATDNSGWSALMIAARIGNAKSVELLLPKSDPKATEKWNGYSALMGAVAYENDKSVELLLPFSDVKATNSQGRTALDLAKFLGYNKIVRLLQQHSSAAASGWAGWALAHPEFGSSVIPITTRGADYAHHITASPPGFEIPAASLHSN